jgi:hypothetical protein
MTTGHRDVLRTDGEGLASAAPPSLLLRADQVIE